MKEIKEKSGTKLSTVINTPPKCRTCKMSMTKLDQGTNRGQVFGVADTWVWWCYRCQSSLL